MFARKLPCASVQVSAFIPIHTFPPAWVPFYQRHDFSLSVINHCWECLPHSSWGSWFHRRHSEGFTLLVVGNEAALEAHWEQLLHSSLPGDVTEGLSTLKNGGSRRASSTLVGQHCVAYEVVSSQVSRVNCPTRPDLISKAVAKHCPEEGDCVSGIPCPLSMRTMDACSPLFAFVLLIPTFDTHSLSLPLSSPPHTNTHTHSPSFSNLSHTQSLSIAVVSFSSAFSNFLPSVPPLSG